MPAKLHINLQQGIVDVEGDDDLVKGVYADFKEHLLNGAKSTPSSVGDNFETAAPAGVSGTVDLSTNSIAARLSVSKGSDLVIAAVAHLMLCQGKGKCTRKQINDEMKGATTYYKSSMTNNLTKSLDALVKAQRLNQISKDVYALSAAEKTSLESQLAQ